MASRIVGALALATVMAAFVRADDPKKAGKPSASDLSLEVAALRTLHYLKATPAQVQALQKLSRDAAREKKKRESKASAEYVQALADLRDALVEDDDDDQIDNLEEQLEQLTRKEKPELDHAIETTPTARKRAAEALRLFRATQVASFIAAYADEVSDPLETLLDALVQVRKLPLEEWKEKRDDWADTISQLVAGADAAKSTKSREEILALLGKARSLDAKEVETKQPELERQARAIVGDLGPTDVLRNIMENTLAELLSNPRLGPVLEAKLK
jgi:hypothetical protein